ncbi:MAG TPA: TonB family protein [Blastocatellia bacterium]|nr:TonB family protein [Blastocatellia bacterium]
MMSTNRFVARSLFSSAAAALVFSLFSQGSTRGPTGILEEPVQETAQQHVQKARDALQKENYRAAKDEAKRALSLDKGTPEAYLLLGMIYRREGKWGDALRYTKEALKHKPDYSDAHYILGLLYFQKSDFAHAREEANLVISQGSRFPNVYVLLAQAGLASRNYPEALSAFETALRLTPPGHEDAIKLQAQIEALKGWIESTGRRLDPSYVQPKLLNSPQPEYTEEARAAGIQGTVRLAVLVSEAGKVASTLVFLGLGFGLDEQAVKAVRKLRFKPATKDGTSVPFWKLVAVEFNLR